MRHPFAPLPIKRGAGADKRRSTRVNAAVPIILSGRDAAGQPFRDETQTMTVNLHGARIRSSRDLLVGVLVTIECVATGAVAKAVCVRTIETVPGTNIRHIAVRLVHPGNIWGIKEPPEDWCVVEQTQVAQPAQAAEGAPVADPEISVEAADLELQANQIVDAATLRLRGLVEEMLGAAFEDFQQRLDATLAPAEARLNERSAESLAQTDTALKQLREELNSDLELRAAQAVASTEQALRTQVPNILASILAPVKSAAAPRVQVKPHSD